MTLIIILGLAAARLTRLVLLDSILERPRAWWQAKLGEWATADDKRRRTSSGKWLLALLECPFCFSAWVSAGLIGVTWLVGTHVPLPVFAWLAAWWVACFAYWLLELVYELHEETVDRRNPDDGSEPFVTGFQIENT